MGLLILEAFFQLIRFDFYLAHEDFAILHGKVRGMTIQNRVDRPRSVDQICNAVNIACIWYWKQVLCLQRSAATACLLKEYGFAAQMVIGAQQLPFKAHAWVEVGQRVVNDKPYIREIYAVLDRW